MNRQDDNSSLHPDWVPDPPPHHPLELPASVSNNAELNSESPSGDSESPKDNFSSVEATSIAEPVARENVVIPGDPLVVAAAHPHPPDNIPEDVRVSWSWPHLLLFVLFAFGSLIVVQLTFVFYVSTKTAGHLSTKQMEEIFEGSPQLLVGTNVVWYGLLLVFLYLSLAVFRSAPFWRSLGWRELQPNPATGKNDGWKYFFSGAGLAIFVAVASYNVKNADHLPIQEMFKNRSGALLLMAMAVLVAPLVEETVFRGYLYPLFAKSLGVLPSVLLTGVLFGLMHGSQLGWTWGLVSLLTLVGVIFTFARSRTGTVLASFLMHLGYNSMIAASSIIATKGFTHMPTP